MAGHSKWANIKHRKNAQDSKRAQIFAKLSKEITIVASQGGIDVQTNPKLRLLVSKAKSFSMPKKNIETAINKASGNTIGKDYQELSYAANVGGVSFLILCLANNANRLASSIQAYINHVGGQVLNASAVNYIFERKGVLEFLRTDPSQDEEYMLKVLELGGTDFEIEDQSYFVYTTTNDFNQIKTNLEKLGIKDWKEAQITFLPNQTVKLSPEKAQKILNLVERLEEDEDVQEVFHNLDFDSFKE